MTVRRSMRKKLPEPVKSEALYEEHLRLIFKEHVALVRDLRKLVQQVSELASCLRSRSSAGERVF